ncbi:uncharacterized protein LAESUDRAFT_419654 [Laetiporus sulphureus 93-53]|uniref:C2H2-type domain-containing protein n=1 Tax=Laetiporus sulphureus 93-53 TaxID=1314785 RepID=A0A165GG29_9APHY|nr:uncharacterized protein LAESUDRAFT_419654 [Laetiporus sulphureus 93-53]KZT10299.1 hypothetical protein LAESUDRAFT_419654 [Laetiporus sulphureus 93-53]
MSHPQKSQSSAGPHSSGNFTIPGGHSDYPPVTQQHLPSSLQFSPYGNDWPAVPGTQMTSQMNQQYYQSPMTNAGYPVDTMPTQAAVSAGPPQNLQRCTWEGGWCGIYLDDLTPSGIQRHLKDHHFNTKDRPWSNRNRGKCLWSPDCRSDLMNYESLGKHIAQVHLKSTLEICDICGGHFARSDALLRHRRENCG